MEGMLFFVPFSPSARVTIAFFYSHLFFSDNNKTENRYLDRDPNLFGFFLSKLRVF